MEVIRETTDFHIERPTAVCIGKFDGVHMGHKKLIEELFSGVQSNPIYTRFKKQELLEELGIELVIEYPLTFETAAIDPVDFIEEVLVGKLHMRYIAAGPDLSYGKGGKGDKVLIEAMSERYGYQVEIIEKVGYEGEDISSSRIREAIDKGDLGRAERMLGRK